LQYYDEDARFQIIFFVSRVSSSDAIKYDIFSPFLALCYAGTFSGFLHFSLFSSYLAVVSFASAYPFPAPFFAKRARKGQEKANETTAKP
jgi:hypothetical protein